MNWYSIFYWLTVADNLRVFFIVMIVIFMIVMVISTVAYLACGSEDICDNTGQKMARKWMWWSYPFGILFWLCYLFTPSKKAALLIIAGGGTLNFITTDSTTKQIPHELASFVLTELKNMAADAKVELNIANQKEKMLDEAKQMTTQELLDRMKVDSNFSKIILDK